MVIPGSETMADRKAELERKKAKLQAIREEKERRRREKEAKEAEENAAKRPERDLRQEAEEMLSSLGIMPPGELLSSLGSVGTSEQSTTSTPEPSLQMVSPKTTPVSQRKKPQLSIVNVHQTNIAPKEHVTYEKQTQTATSASEREAHPVDYYVLVYDDLGGEDDDGSSLPTLESGASPPVYTHAPHHKMTPGMPHVEMVRPVHVSLEDQGMQISTLEEKQTESRELSEEEKQQILLSQNFQKFFDRASRVIERALWEDVDIFVDYAGGDKDDKENEDKTGVRLAFNRCFYDERWSKNRTITCLDWSTQYPELLVASYNNNDDSPHDPDGVALIWNMKFKKNTPEYVFHCQSPVMTATFAKFHPHLIVGGTYSGQIVLWDNRCGKHTPIQRSPLSAAAHTHPVYCVKVVGTQNAHNVVSISTDGKFCSWSLDMLSAPQDSMELQHKQSKAVAVMSLSFPPGDVNNFIVGSEEGTVFTACRHGSKAGITDMYEGHQGPVTGVDTHAVAGPIDFSHLFVTSSFDWTVKLWSLKENKPLYSFEDYGDYVYDVSWSPVHPALFASVDGTGKLDLWNLNADTEAPTASVIVDNYVALNRVSWFQSGLQVVAGDDTGKVWVYDVGEQLGIPRADDWSKFLHTLQEFKNNQADEELDQSYMSAGGVSSGNVSLSSSPLSSLTPLR